MPFGKSRSKYLRVFKFLTVFALLLGLGAVASTWLVSGLQSFSSVKSQYKPSDVWIVDRYGEPLESIRTGHDQRSLEWTSLHDISPSFRDLLVQGEDRRFYQHVGVDFFALGRILAEHLTGASRRGASTITMQLTGLLEEKVSNSRRSWDQKWHQIILALKLERSWSKNEVLEAYSNLAPFRGELVGIRAASLGFFKKNPSGLLEEESALLIAQLRAPNASPEIIAKRACILLKRDDCISLEQLSLKVFSQPYQLSRSRQTVPVLSDLVIEGSRSSSVRHTSLDKRIQQLALSTLQEQLRTLHSQNVRDGAVLILETKTGRVVAYAGNAGPGLTSAEQVDGIQTRRQAGSTIKPFVYATAFDLRLLQPQSLLDDSPADIAVSMGRVYHPRNYDHIFRGLVSSGEALGSSLNVPAVRALQLVGEERVLEKLRELGFQDLQSDDYYGPSLALGSVDVTLWELTHGYRQFSLEGSAFSDQARLDIFNILASPEYRRMTFGVENLLTLPIPAAVKTGTSKDMRDNWCIGWTPEYTIGVWVGNFNGEPMWNVSGMSGAAPVWRRMMLALHPQGNFPAPRYIAPTAALEEKSISRIRYPASEMLVGLDPDIPKNLQRLPIEISSPQRGQKIFLNRRLVGSAKETTLWPIQRGKYQIELKNIDGSLADSVRFEVR